MPEKKKASDYVEAMKQLETIVSKMESGELNIDALAKELKTAQGLIKLCRDKLTKTEEDIKKNLMEK